MTKNCMIYRMKPGEEVAVFNRLFERISSVAERLPDGITHEEDWLPPPNGTRLTTEKVVGGTALMFMIFSSETKSLEHGRDLYSPSITVFRGDSPQTDEHINRNDLEVQSNSPSQIERNDALRLKLETAKELFDQYEQTQN
jgi:hypothetical protein